MKIVSVFFSLVFAIYAGVRGLEFIRRDDNSLILFGICCLLLAIGTAYIVVKSALQKNTH